MTESDYSLNFFKIEIISDSVIVDRKVDRSSRSSGPMKELILANWDLDGVDNK